jgi:hypothetical protein
MDEAPQTDPYDDFKAATPAPQGRAARRRQLARWKKNQRRAVVATAVALVGGGLTVAAMDRNSADQAQAATAPDIAGMGTAEDQASQQPGPSSTRPETQRTARTPVQSPAAGLTRRQSAAALPSTTPPNVRTDSAAVPRATATSAPQPRTTSPSSAETVSDRTATAPTQTPAPSATTGTSSGSSQASPAPAATSPSQICLLVVCLG